jgi:Acetyltransferase (GNAT) family.
MECKVFRFPKDLIELSEGLRWEKLIFKGKKSNVKKWIECYNEAFREHFGMRPLSYKELMSYTLEKSFDAEAYFGIFDEKSKAFIAECSCEIDEELNKFKNISRCVIWTVGVRKAYRGKGFGKKLVYKALDYMLKRNIETAAIHVDEKMKLPTIFIEASDLRQKDIDHFLLKRFNKIPVISENIL